MRSGRPVRNCSTNCSMPRSLLATCQCSWAGSTATSRVALLTSMPTYVYSAVVLLMDDLVRPDCCTRPSLADTSSPRGRLRQLSGLGTAGRGDPAGERSRGPKGLWSASPLRRSSTMAEHPLVIQGLLALDLVLSRTITKEAHKPASARTAGASAACGTGFAIW